MTDERQLVKSLECLCRWKDLPHNIHETEKLALFLRKLFPIEDSETIEILKEDDENLRISTPTVGNPYLVRPDKERPFFIRLNKEKNKAILTENDLTHYEFLVKGTANPLLCLNQNIGLGSVKAIYRNLRENYEFRMRYDEAGEFFIREMELKRNYREIPLQPTAGLDSITVKNNWFRRNLFSLTGWYYHLSRYGEDILRPTLAGAVIVLLSTLFWITQSQPTLTPNINFTNIDPKLAKNTSSFIYFNKATDPPHLLKAFERSIAGFIPLLSMGNAVEVGAIDYAIKIVGGAVTFGLIAIALRRRFERRFRH